MWLGVEFGRLGYSITRKRRQIGLFELDGERENFACCSQTHQHFNTLTLQHINTYTLSLLLLHHGRIVAEEKNREERAGAQRLAGNNTSHQQQCAGGFTLQDFQFYPSVEPQHKKTGPLCLR